MVRTLIKIHFDCNYNGYELIGYVNSLIVAYGNVKIIYRESSIQIVDDPLTVNLTYSLAEVSRIEAWIE